MTTLWDTTGGEVVRGLTEERRTAGAVAFGLVLTLVVVVDERNAGAALAAASTASQAHPCRLLVVVRRQPDLSDPRLDAEIHVGDRIGGLGEAVVLRMYGPLARHAESVVLPLLAPDTPVVTWWFGPPPEQIGHDPLGALANRRITDSAAGPEPLDALRQRAADYHPGDTDFAWTRLSGWRSLLAAAFDSLTARASAVPASAVPVNAVRVNAVRVSAERDNPSALLLGGWLSTRLEVAAASEVTGGPGITETAVTLVDSDGRDLQVRVSRPDGHTVTVSRTDHPDRVLPLPRRDLGNLLAEELRHLDADEPYAETLAAVAAPRPA